MLRNKVICAFVAVWCVVCLSYVGIRSALGMLVGQADPSSRYVAAESSELEQKATTPSNDDSRNVTSPQSEVIPQSELIPQERTSSSAEAIPQAESTSAQEALPTVEEVPLEGTLPAGDTPADASEPSDAQPAEQQPEVPGIPSLYEYLGQFTCGSCRRNCSLANPRCNNGARLADAKAQEYYDIYEQ